VTAINVLRLDMTAH